MPIYVINKRGERIFQVKDFTEVRSFSDGLAVVRNERSFCGFINKQGELVIEPKFFEASSFSEDVAIVKTNEKGFLFQPETKWGFIDKTGKILFETDFEYLYDFSEEIAVGIKGNDYFLIDRNGNKTFFFNSHETQIAVWEKARFSEGLIAAFDLKTEKCGFIDKTAKFVIEPTYENAANFSEGLARVSIIKNQREYLGFINKKGEYAIEPKFDIDFDFLRCANDFSEGLASLVDGPLMMEKDQNFMFINNTGEIVLQTEFFRAESFHEEFAVVWDAESSKSGYIDKSGKLVFPLKFYYASDFSEGLAVVAEY